MSLSQDKCKQSHLLQYISTWRVQTQPSSLMHLISGVRTMAGLRVVIPQFINICLKANPEHNTSFKFMSPSCFLSILKSLSADESVCFIKHLQSLVLHLPALSSPYKHQLTPTTPEVRGKKQSWASWMVEVKPKKEADSREIPSACPVSSMVRSSECTTQMLFIRKCIKA